MFHEVGKVAWERPEGPSSHVRADDLRAEFVVAADGARPFTNTGCHEYTRAIERPLPLLQWALN